MKTYTACLDVLTLLFLALSVQFLLNENYIVEDLTGRRGVLHVRVITWQTFFVIATFCVFLRYVARKLQ